MLRLLTLVLVELEADAQATCDNMPELCVLGATGDLGPVSDCGPNGPTQADCCAYMTLGCVRGVSGVGASCSSSLDCASGHHCHCTSSRRRAAAVKRLPNWMKGKGRRLFGAPSSTDFADDASPPSPPSCSASPGTCMANALDAAGIVINGHGLCCGP